MSKQEIYNYSKKQTDEVPYFPDDSYYVIYFRGFFEQYGNISRITSINNVLTCEIMNKNKKNIIKNIKDFFKLKTTFFDKENGYICYSGSQALNFLFRLYNDSDARLRKEEYFRIFLIWINFKSSFFHLPKCKIIKTSPLSIIPKRINFTDIGYDIHIVKKICSIDNNTSIYDTGLIILPDINYFAKIVCKTSLIENGYILNSCPVIEHDENDTSLKIYLTKINDSISDLKLPFSFGKLILETQIYFDCLDEEII